MSSGLLAVFALCLCSAYAFPYSFPDCVNGPLKNNAVCDITKDPTTRAQAVIDLFTVSELINNTVNESPGVPRLGLPGYQWWSEALVHYFFTSNEWISLMNDNSTASHRALGSLLRRVAILARLPPFRSLFFWGPPSTIPLSKR